MGKLCGYGNDHLWEWRTDIMAWECTDCHYRVIGNAYIEPCLCCGATVDANLLYCEDCTAAIAAEDEEGE